MSKDLKRASSDSSFRSPFFFDHFKDCETWTSWQKINEEFEKQAKTIREMGQGHQTQTAGYSYKIFRTSLIQNEVRAFREIGNRLVHYRFYQLCLSRWHG